MREGMWLRMREGDKGLSKVTGLEKDEDARGKIYRKEIMQLLKDEVSQPESGTIEAERQ